MLCKYYVIKVQRSKRKNEKIIYDEKKRKVRKKEKERKKEREKMRRK
jgi:hypothetical protein